MHFADEKKEHQLALSAASRKTAKNTKRKSIFLNLQFSPPHWAKMEGVGGAKWSLGSRLRHHKVYIN